MDTPFTYVGPMVKEGSSEDLDQTMKIRKAVMPMLESFVKSFIDEFDKHIHVEFPKDVAITLSEKELSKMFEAAIRKIEYPKQMTVDGEVRISNPIEIPKVLDVRITKDSTKGEFLHLFDEFVSYYRNPKIQKVEGKVTVEAIDGLKKSIDELLEYLTLVGAPKLELPEIVDVNIKNWEHVISESGGGMKSVSDRDRIWFREEFTYDVNNNVTRVEKWNNNYKLIEDYQYDANGNVIVKSRSLEAMTVVGV